MAEFDVNLLLDCFSHHPDTGTYSYARELRQGGGSACPQCQKKSAGCSKCVPGVPDKYKDFQPPARAHTRQDPMKNPEYRDLAQQMREGRVTDKALIEAYRQKMKQSRRTISRP